MAVCKHLSNAMPTATMESLQPLTGVTSDSGSATTKETQAPVATTGDFDVAAEDTPTKSTPIEKLINIAELCENVLDHLTLNELL